MVRGNQAAGVDRLPTAENWTGVNAGTWNLQFLPQTPRSPLNRNPPNSNLTSTSLLLGVGASPIVVSNRISETFPSRPILPMLQYW
jgi:hypothetical protein